MGLLPLFGYSVEPCECHCTHCLVDVFSFLLGIYPEVTFLGHSITVLKNLSNCVMAAPSSIGPVYAASGLSFLSLHQHTVRAWGFSVLYFWGRVSLNWLSWNYVNQAGLELTDYCFCFWNAGIKGLHHHAQWPLTYYSCPNECELYLVAVSPCIRKQKSRKQKQKKRTPSPLNGLTILVESVDSWQRSVLGS